MANRFWVAGGNGNFSSTTNWASSTGGSSGATAPGAGDDAFFDANSGSGTVTIDAATAVHSWDMTNSPTRTIAGASGFAVTIGGGATLTTAAVFKLKSGCTWSSTGTNTLDNRSGGLTVTTAAVTLPSVTIASTNSGAVVFADSISVTNAAGSTLTTNGTGGITFTSGTTVTCKALQVSGASAAITYSGVTINCTGTTVAPIGFSAAPTLTGNSSSQLNATAWTTGGALAFSTASFPGTVTITLAGTASTQSQTGTPTFTNYTLSGGAVSQTSMSLGVSAFTVSGILTIAGASQRQRPYVFATSASPGGQATITVNGSFALSNVDFHRIASGGSAGTWTGTNLGNGQSNTGITFTNATTCYWVGGSSGNWTDVNKWASTSGGSAGTAGCPLPQDSVVFDATSISSNSSTITWDVMTLPTLDTSAVTATGFVLNNGAQSTAVPLFAGNITLSSTTTLSFTASIATNWYKDSGTFIITQNGGTMSMGAQAGGSQRSSVFYVGATFVGNTVLTNYLINLSGMPSGTFDISSGDFDCWAFLCSNAAPTVAFKGHRYTARANLANATAFQLSGGSNKFTNVGLADFWVINSGVTVNVSLNLNNTPGCITLSSATGQVNFSTAGKVATIAAPPGLTVQFVASGTFTIGQLEWVGKSGSVITIQSSAAGTAFTLSCPAGVINCDWLSLKDCTASGGATFYKGANTATVSNVTGWTAGSGPARQQLMMAGVGGY